MLYTLTMPRTFAPLIALALTLGACPGDAARHYPDCTAGCPEDARCYSLISADPAGHWRACAPECDVGDGSTCPQDGLYSAECVQAPTAQPGDEHPGACVLGCVAGECPEGMACAPGNRCLWLQDPLD